MKTIKRSITHARAADGSVVLSTDTPCPQDGLILAPGGWDLSRFAKVPCKMFYNHAASWGEDLPIGRWDGLEVRDGKLCGTPVFAVEEYDKAATVAKLWDGGFLDDVSVSFRVNGKALTGPVQVEGRDYMVSTSHELLECSIVGIGADQNAGKGRIAEAVTRGVITEEEAREFDEVTPGAEPWRAENEELRTQVNTLREGLETLTATLDRLREEIARAATPAAPVDGTAAQRTTDEPEAITLDLEAVRAASLAALSETVERIVHVAICRATGRLPD